MTFVDSFICTWCREQSILRTRCITEQRSILGTWCITKQQSILGTRCITEQRGIFGPRCITKQRSILGTRCVREKSIVELMSWTFHAWITSTISIDLLDWWRGVPSFVTKVSKYSLALDKNAFLFLASIHCIEQPDNHLWRNIGIWITIITGFH